MYLLMFGNRLRYTLMILQHHTCIPWMLFWAHLATRTNADGSSQFTLLSKVAHLVLTILHSNAAAGMRFFHGQEEQNPVCPNLDPDEPLGSKITTKMALPQDTLAYKFDAPKEPLVAAKKATMEVGLEKIA